MVSAAAAVAVAIDGPSFAPLGVHRARRGRLYRLSAVERLWQLDPNSFWEQNWPLKSHILASPNIAIEAANYESIKT